MAQVVNGTIDGPLVQGLQRFGVHRQPTSLVLTFDEPLDPTSAQDLANYQNVRLDHRGRSHLRTGRSILIQ